MPKLILSVFMLVAIPLAAQQPSDRPSVKVGGQLFADYTYTASVEPPVRDADGNEIHPSSFNVSRAYINLFGTLNKYLSVRVTPEFARETGSGSSLSGSLTSRLKFAYLQVNLDQWLTKGSWIRAGLTQTPWIDYEDTVYRYRFQGPVLIDREAYLFSSDYGISGHYNFPGDFGDLQLGIYNGEGWAHSEVNDQKALQMRVTARPVPGTPALYGLRVTGFYDADHYAAGQPRNRAIGQVTYEHPRVVAGLDLFSASDQRTAMTADVKSRGYSAWATPKFGHGWEALLRRDSITPDTRFSDRKTRDIEGIAYWFPLQNGVSSAVMLDRDATRGPAPATHTTNYGLKLMVTF